MFCKNHSIFYSKNPSLHSVGKKHLFMHSLQLLKRSLHHLVCTKGKLDYAFYNLLKINRRKQSVKKCLFIIQKPNY